MSLDSILSILHMCKTFDRDYFTTPTGALNIAELVCLLGATISVGLTSRLYCEFADNLRWIYPELSTLLIRSVYQAFAIFCFTITIAILIIHFYGIRFTGRNYLYINRLCLVFNVIMGIMMISIGIGAAFWEDKLRRTPTIVRRGYLENRYQNLSNEITHPRPGAAAAAASFGILTGILFIIEACTRPMLNTGAIPISTHYARPIVSDYASKRNNRSERIIPIERVIALA